jgi:hypothetical protein
MKLLPRYGVVPLGQMVVNRPTGARGVRHTRRDAIDLVVDVSRDAARWPLSS